MLTDTHNERTSSEWDDKAPLLAPEGEAPEPKPKPARRPHLVALAIAAVVAVAVCGTWACYPHWARSTNTPNTPTATPPDTDASRSKFPRISRSELVGSPARWLGSHRHWDTDEPPTTRYYDFVVSAVRAPPGAIEKDMITVNGHSPGPLIEANIGDRIVINVHNHLNDSTSIHWHGMWQRGTNFMDGTMSINGCGIPPGTNASYVWYAQNPGTAWYHSHRGMQYTDGLYGAIVIHSPNEPASKQPYDDELTLMIGDVYNTRSRDLPTKTTGRRPVDAVPDGAVINGVSQARCAYLYPSDEHPGVNWCGHVPTAQYEAELVGGKTYRIRIVNSGSLVPYTFSIDNHTFSVIEADGVSLAPYEARTLSLDVGHRYSILVTLDQPPAAYWMRVHLEVEAQVYKGPKFNATTLGVLRYKGARGAPPDVPGPKIRDGEYDAGPRTIFPPAVPLEAPLPTLQHSVVYGAFLKPDGSSGMTFNDRMWRPLPDGVAAVYFVNASNAHRPKEVARLVGPQHNLLTTQPEVVDLIVNAPHDLATHPFHLHGHSFWIMSQGPGVFDGDSSTLNRTNPMRRDTFVVPPGGHAVIRFVADNPGIWPLHCHIAWHLEGGLLMTVTAMPREMVKFDIPPHMKRLCYKQYA